MKNSKKSLFGIQITSGIGETCWLNYYNLRFSSEADAWEWLNENDIDGKPARIA